MRKSSNSLTIKCWPAFLLLSHLFFTTNNIVKIEGALQASYPFRFFLDSMFLLCVKYSFCALQRNWLTLSVRLARSFNGGMKTWGLFPSRGWNCLTKGAKRSGDNSKYSPSAEIDSQVSRGWSLLYSWSLEKWVSCRCHVGVLGDA